MKNLKYLTFVFASLSSQTFAQNYGIIVKLNNEQKQSAQVISSGSRVKLSFSIEKVDRILDTLDVFSFMQAFPLAKEFKHDASERLSQLYRIEGQFDSKRLVAELRKVNFFEIVEEIGEPITLYTPNDFAMEDPFGQQALVKIRAKDAWDITKGNSSVKIAIIDNGFDVNHEDITNQIVFQDGNVSWTGSGSSHGGRVAGVAASETDNNKGISSIGFNSKLMLYRFNDAYNKMMHASLNGAKVINCSFFNRCNTPASFEQDIINMIVANGTTIVAASGNGNVGNSCYGDWNGDGIYDQNGYTYPASYNNVISVSGTDTDDTYFRGIGGPEPGHFTFNDKVDLTAPGWVISTTVDGNLYSTGSGTSFASPLVAGTVALLLAVKSCLTPQELEFILKLSSNKSVNDPLLFPENQPYMNIAGAGRLDAYNAVNIAQNWPQNASSIVLITGPNTICGEGQFSLNNIKTDLPIVWSSNNTNGLTINSTTGFATRQNNFNGKVTITATINSGCGPLSVTRVVNVGNYLPTGTSSVNSNCSGSTFNVLNTSLSGACTANTPIYFSYKITDSNYSNFVFTPVSVPSGASWSFSGGYLYMTVYTPPSQGSRSATIALSATGPCGTYNVNFNSTAVNYYSGGYYYSSFPNPASETLTIEQTYNTEENREVGTFLKEGSLDTHYFRLYDFNSSRVVLEGSVSRKTEIDVSKLAKGRYILKIQIANDKEETHQVIIN